MNIDNIFYNTIDDENEARRIVEALNEKKCCSKSEPEDESTQPGADEKVNPTNPDDELEVVYSDLKAKLSNIFDHLIIFTNDDDPKNNKTLKNIYDACKELKKAGAKEPKVHVFIASDMTYNTDDDNILSITDGEETLDFEELNNTNTLVFSRLGVQGEDNCEHVVGMLQDRGFLVLNPVRYSELASNKYDTAVLLDKADIPQPNFCLMTRDILHDEKVFMENMKKVYPDWSKDPDENEDKKVVVKILDGHGGTGVFLSDGKRLTAILQAIFAIDEERQLIIQKKEEADGGDIRVHVLTLRNSQKIMAAMKRVKLGGDFRSNVSLGAEAEPVKLTPEQEQIALKAAKVSHLPWCAVDIMPLVKGSNKELGDNVVLELNASPGTAGITEVIDHNFINVILNELTDPKEFYLQDKTAGFMETVSISVDGDKSLDMLAKLDTGNGAKASHMEVGELEEHDGSVTFMLDGTKYTEKIIGRSKAITGSEHHDRPIINVHTLKLGPRMIHDIPMALVGDRDGKSSNILLNRDAMSWLGYIISSYQTHILTQEMDKLKII